MYDTQLESHANSEDAATSPSHREVSAVLHNAVLAGVLDEIDYGLLVLGASAQILFANQPARLELGGERFVRRRQDRLVPSASSHAAKIDAALANARRGQRGLVTLSGTDGELVLSFVPLSLGAQPAVRIAETSLVLVIFGKRDACDTTTLQQYGRLHGLTGAEQALLPAIIRGLSIKAMANQRCVATNTVRAHLGSIREKTGTRSLRTLMVRLSSLPPIRP
jgi:DNA-binding CsgD family transcriptional regulator